VTIKSERGVTQGDPPLSPRLFNSIVHIVDREAKRFMMTTDNNTIFYDDDDGLVTGMDKQKAQEYLNLITDLFSFFVLQMSPGKRTK
jgi:hypothetical protein